MEHQVIAKILKNSQEGEFVQAQFSGTNESGFDPIGYHVMVMMDGASQTTSGGIQLTPDYVEKMSLAAETGVIVAIGDDAFLWNGDRTRKWEGRKPKAGDRVYVERYSGKVILGLDSKVYRIMNYECIMAVQGNARELSQ